MEDADSSTMIDTADFVDTDIPVDNKVPDKRPYLLESERETVRDWGKNELLLVAYQTSCSCIPAPVHVSPSRCRGVWLSPSHVQGMLSHHLQVRSETDPPLCVQR